MANTAPSPRTTGQWDINFNPDMLQPSKKGSESRQSEELLKDVLEMLRLESPARASPLSGHSHLHREPGEKQPLGVNPGYPWYRAKAEN